MTPSPILKVLSSMRKNGVQCLLMGGQACVLYGGAEFSRDVDLVIVSDSANLARLAQALETLQAWLIAVPPFEARYLEMGLAVHFRCRHPDAEGIRVDVMSRMRGVDAFPSLWARRTTLEVGDEVVDLLSLPDLVRAKKTQRDKDWHMITRLLEASYLEHGDTPSPEQVRFWLAELRTPGLLVETAARFPDVCVQGTNERPLLAVASEGDHTRLASELRLEADKERDADRAYWAPLRRELQRLREHRR